MPIDWESIQRAFRLQKRIMMPIFWRLGEYLEKRFKQADRLEQRTHGFPIFGYRNEALMVYIAPHQREAVHKAPTWGEMIRGAGHAFVEGITYAKTSVEEALLLPRLLSTLADAIGAISDSVDRFARPTADMFNPDERKAGDIWGLAALGFRVVIGSLDQIVETAFGAAVLQVGFRKAFEEPGTAGGPGGPPKEEAVSKSLPELLNDAARGLLGAILILPALPIWLETVLTAVGQVIRREALKFFDKIEREVFSLRRSVFELFFADLPAVNTWLGEVFKFVKLVVESNLGFFVSFAKIYVGELVPAIKDFSTQLKDTVDFWVGFILVLLDFVEKVGDIDVGPLIEALIFNGIPTGILGTVMIGPMKLRDLIGPGAGLLREGIDDVIDTLQDALTAAKIGNTILDWVFGAPDFTGDIDELKKKLDLVKQIVDIFITVEPAIHEKLNKTDVAMMDDIGKTIIDPMQKALTPKLAATRDTLLEEVDKIFTKTGDTMTQLSDAFYDASAKAVRLGFPSSLGKIIEKSEEQANAAFGTQIKDLKEKIAKENDPVAAGFGDWLTSGGFDMIEKAIPFYVAEMDRYWRAQKGTPRESSAVLTDKMLTETTSPHILQKRRVKLARVWMKKLEIKVSSPKVDRALADRIADEFEQQMVEAYIRGHDKLIDMYVTVEKRWVKEQKKLHPKSKPVAPPPPPLLGGP